jgi:ubiquitin-protein ligase
VRNFLDRQRILREAQKIAKEFSFWMVSGNITHLYGYVLESPAKKYELEIKFNENFPEKPPDMIYHDEIKDLMGEFELINYLNWTSESSVVNIIRELKTKILEALQKPEETVEEPIETVKKDEKSDETFETEEYVTPDLDAYPPDFQYDDITPQESSENYNDQTSKTQIEKPDLSSTTETYETVPEPIQKPLIEEEEQLSIVVNTELGLIQQEYAYDQISQNPAVINVYITVTLAKTFLVRIDFASFPEQPKIQFPEEVDKLLGNPLKVLNTLNNWDSKKPIHIVDILHELEKKLSFIKEIESQIKKITGEYQSEKISESLTTLKVNLLTYGFKEYSIDINLETYPAPPIVELPSELQHIINIPITELTSYKNWIDDESEPVEIVREISWLVDKNSRINFEIDLLKDHYKDIVYDPLTTTLNVEMKGKMKTEDITFEFQINLPEDYPMKIPEIKVVNEFELEAHEKIKNDLHTSFDDFFNEWTPFSYLIDLFNLISKKIFEVSVVSCVICHKLECPICSKKIAGEDNCHAECPHCNRAYHQHCWEQTIKSFGKCGFCLR